VLTLRDVPDLSDCGDGLPIGCTQTGNGKAAFFGHVAEADELGLEPFILRHSISAWLYWW
jgi:hypothetical protein